MKEVIRFGWASCGHNQCVVSVPESVPQRRNTGSILVWVGGALLDLGW